MKYANSKRDECYIGEHLVFREVGTRQLTLAEGVLSETGVKVMREDAKRAAKELAELKDKRAGLELMPDTFCSATLKMRKEVTKDTRCVLVRGLVLQAS